MSNRNKSYYALPALILCGMLLIASCAAQPQVATSVKPNASPVAASPAAAQSPALSAQPETAVPSSAAVTTPEPWAAPAGSFTVNGFSAGDGKTIYYASADGIHQMSLDGSDDQTVKIKNCCGLVGMTEANLFYLVYDFSYKPDAQEQDWQGCVAYNLMALNRKTLKSSKLQTHVYQACAASGNIYMIDHTNHTRIFIYSMADGSRAELKGYPQGVDDLYAAQLESYQDKPYLDCEISQQAHSYQIQGDTLDPHTERVDPPEGVARYEYNGDGTVSIWSPTGYKALDITNAEDVVEYKDSLYISTLDFDNMDEEQNIPCSLYKVSFDGTVESVAQASSPDELISDEIVDGWLFTFWFTVDDDRVQGVVLKQKLS